MVEVDIVKMTCCFLYAKLTVQNVSKSLGTKQLLEARHFILEVTHQLVVGILVDDGITFDILSSVGIAVEENNKKMCNYTSTKTNTNEDKRRVLKVVNSSFLI